MNRLEALRTLGLDEDATSEDIKIAYRETVQILHPDKFASNKKLQERATEQFKYLQEAYDFLNSQKKSHNVSSKGKTNQTSYSNSYTSAQKNEARIAGITAARTQLVAQRDIAFDERRNGIFMMLVGLVVAFFTGRRFFVGIFGMIAAVASTVAVWGIVKTISAQSTINTLNEHIKKLQDEERNLIKELEKEEQ